MIFFVQKFLKSIFRISVISFVIVSLFCVKASAVSYDDYAVLIAKNGGNIGFAGLGYTLSDDEKTLTLNFQITDNHSYSGMNEIDITVNYGDKIGNIKLSADKLICDKGQPWEVKASSFKTKTFVDYTNVYAELELYFSKPICEKLWFEIIFTDSDGNSSEKVRFEFPFALDVPGTELNSDRVKDKTEKTIKTEKSTKNETSEKQTEKKSAIKGNGKKDSRESEYFGNYTASEKNVIPDKFYSSEGSLSEEVDISSQEKVSEPYNKRKVTLIITAAVLLSIGAACAVIAFRKGKGKGENEKTN